MKLKKTLSLIIAAVMLTVSVLALPAEAASVVSNLYNNRIKTLINCLNSDTETLKTINTFGKYVVFISVSDGTQKAKVYSAKASSLNTALNTALSKSRKSGVVPKWMKLDVVISDERVNYSDFIKNNTDVRHGSLRQGIAFSSNYGTALLEAQINSCGMLDYETGLLDISRVNKEISAMGKKTLGSIPSAFYLFKTQGYFSENNTYAYKLTNGDYNDTGRREYPVTRENIEALSGKVADYVCSIAGSDGKLVYGYYPIDNKEIEGYNIIRHAGSMWNLSMLYEMSRDDRILPVLSDGLKYLTSFVKYKDKKTAFVQDANTFNLGGNGLALLAYTMYADVTGSTKYNSVIEALANGILYMQKSDGHFVHAIDRYTYNTVRDFIVIYYDGEAAYGLLRAYDITKDSRYLSAAKKAADNFIARDLVSEHSHWMSYVFCEITKFAPEERYFEFGLKNVDQDDYAIRVYNTKSGINASAETTAAAFDMYVRLMNGGYKCAYLETFRAKWLLRTVIQRAEYNLNYVMFPEYAMYFEAPETVVYSLAVREDDFRIRIDDIQHFMDSYYLYWKNYDNVEYYRELLLTDNNTAAKTAA